MYSAGVLALILCIAHAPAKAPGSLTDGLVDELFDRKLNVGPLLDADLDGTSIGKASHLAASQRSGFAIPIHAAQSTSRRASSMQRAVGSHPLIGFQLAVARVGPACGVWYSPTARETTSRVVARATSSGSTSMREAKTYEFTFDPATKSLGMDNIPDEIGIYAIFDTGGNVQYIGLSKRIKLSVEAHANTIGPGEAPFLMASLKSALMPGSPKEELQNTWKSWIQEHIDSGGNVPPGNLPDGAPGYDPRWKGKGVQKGPLKLGARGIRSMDDALASIKETLTKHPVVLFMKGTPEMPQCGFSARTIAMLADTGVKYESVNVLDDVTNPFVRDAVKIHSSWPTIPQLYAGGEFIGGCDIITQMAQDDELRQTLEDAVTGSSESAATGNGGAASTEAVVPGNIELINSPSRPTASQMSNRLNTAFTLHTLRIVDDSAAHAGDAGALEMGLTGESHFTVTLISPDFEGLSPVKRQQKVYSALGDLMSRIHAISLVTRTPAEISR